MEESMEEILKGLEIAERNWKKLLKETENKKEVKKPEILNIGPKPIRFIKKLIKEPVIPKVDLPKIKKNRGDYRSLMKRNLNVLKHELSYEKDKDIQNKLEAKIIEIKKNLKDYTKNKKKKKIK